LAGGVGSGSGAEFLDDSSRRDAAELVETISTAAVVLVSSAGGFTDAPDVLLAAIGVRRDAFR
jgi:hypothetical protein